MTSKVISGAVRAVLADLDDTLFDHHHATRAALAVLHADVPAFRVWPREEFEARHAEVLEVMHRAVLAGRQSIESARAERFRRLLESAAQALPAHERAPVDAGTSAFLAHRYRDHYELAWQPVPGAMALAAAVKRAGLALVIVTNNVTREQQLKLERCGLLPLVDALITSEDVGATKPDTRIFDAALSCAGVHASEAVMVGDSWHTDVVGALAAGVRSVWLNRAGHAAPDPEVAAGVAELRSLEPLDDAWRVIIG